MHTYPISDKDKKRARHCLNCPICNHARSKQHGLAFWLVKHVETGLCPFGNAYTRVYERKPHEV